jgi:hypothetical protein
MGFYVFLFLAQKVKGKGHSRTVDEGPEGSRGIALLFL